MDFNVIFETMFVLFGSIIIGYILNKLNIFNKESDKVLSSLIVKLTSPMMIIASVCNNKSDDKGIVFVFLILGVGLYLCYIILAKILVRIFKIPKNDSSIYQILLIFANTGFMGYPIAKAVYGEQAVFYMSILHMCYNLLIFSYGIYLINPSKENTKFDFKTFINAGFVSSILALIIYLFGIKIAKPVTELISLIGSVTIPLSMLVMGSSLTMIKVKGIFKETKLITWSLLKMIVIPIVIFFIANVISDDRSVVGMLILSAALPSGSLIIMLSNQYKGNVKLASLGVFITTLLSIITLPIIIYFLL